MEDLSNTLFYLEDLGYNYVNIAEGYKTLNVRSTRELAGVNKEIAAFKVSVSVDKLIELENGDISIVLNRH